VDTQTDRPSSYYEHQVGALHQVQVELDDEVLVECMIEIALKLGDQILVGWVELGGFS